MSVTKKTKLELSDSSGEETDIKVNSSYAESYNRFREKELLQTLKDRYKGVDQDESSSSSSSEEEDYPEFDNAFFKTLSLLKEKNSKIYDGQTDFFPRMKSKPKPKSKTEKKLTLRDLERNVMTKNEGKFEEIPNVSEKGYYEELDEIKESFKGIDDDMEEEDNDDEDLLQAKTKTDHEVKKEEDEYKSWLMDQKNEKESPSNAQELKGLKEFWSRRDLDSNEKFLRDYILKEKYKDQGGDEDSEEEEVEEDIDDRIHDSDDNLSEDEKTVEKMEEFETKFNFRFEEPDPDFIKRYPRTIEDSMRKKDESRKRKRETTKLKKEMEKTKKLEELKQLKSLKRAEILEKIKKIQNVAGTEDVNFEEEDLEEDFDPESYDKRMKEIFKNYDDNVVDEEKPVFPDIGDSDIENDLEVENWDDWKPSQEHDVQNNDEEGDSMTVNEEKDDKYTFQKEVLSTLGRRKGKRKSKFAEIIEKKKPIFDSKMNKTFENYLNEYYKLDCEDIIGDLPCRFKYRNVQKNAFGLEVEEILSAPDRELNAWCSLKKTCQYRDERDEKADVVSYENKRGNIQLKEKILPSLFVSNSEENLEAERMKKSQKSKRNRKNLSKEKNQVDMEKKTTDSQEESNTDVKQNKSTVIQNNSIATTSSKAQGLNTETSKNNRKRKRNKNFTKQATSGAKNININAEIQMSDQRLEAYGLAPGKFKRKIRQKKFNKD